MTALVGAFTGVSTFEGPTITAALSAPEVLNSLALLSDEGNGVPFAHLNFMLFDENFVYQDGGAKRVSNTAATQHETLTWDITIPQRGYLFVYVSNESEWDVRTYFDELVIDHEYLDVIQHDDYYPFGLSHNQQPNRELNNKYLYNGKEWQTDLNLGWYDYGARMYDAALGRFTSQDRFSEKYHTLSTYQYAANNPIFYIDVNGDSLDVHSIMNDPMLSQVFELFARSKDGLQFLSQFASKGQGLYGHTFEEDGAFHSEGINLSIMANELSTKFGAKNGQTDFEPSESGINVMITINSYLNTDGFHSSDAAIKLKATSEAFTKGNVTADELRSAANEFRFERVRTLVHEGYQHAQRFANDYTRGGIDLLNTKSKHEWGVYHHNQESPNSITNYRTKGLRILQSANSKLNTNYSNS